MSLDPKLAFLPALLGLSSCISDDDGFDDDRGALADGGTEPSTAFDAGHLPVSVNASAVDAAVPYVPRDASVCDVAWPGNPRAFDGPTDDFFSSRPLDGGADADWIAGTPWLGGCYLELEVRLVDREPTVCARLVNGVCTLTRIVVTLPDGERLGAARCITGLPVGDLVAQVYFDYPLAGAGGCAARPGLCEGSPIESSPGFDVPFRLICNGTTLDGTFESP